MRHSSSQEEQDRYESPQMNKRGSKNVKWGARKLMAAHLLHSLSTHSFSLSREMAPTVRLSFVCSGVSLSCSFIFLHPIFTSKLPCFFYLSALPEPVHLCLSHSCCLLSAGLWSTREAVRREDNSGAAWGQEVQRTETYETEWLH